MSTEFPNSVWLAADYHFPSAYSIRMPMTGMNSALALPAPGPGTVRLALISRGIELFGLEFTRDELFPTIRQMAIQIRPPERVALSNQVIRGYKASPDGEMARFDEAPVYREIAVAAGVMTLFLNLPENRKELFSQLLFAIGYWGQTSSFATCVGTNAAAPNGEVAVPFESLVGTRRLRPFFSSPVSEFRDAELAWDEVTPGWSHVSASAIRPVLYVWPLLICEQHGGGKMLVRCSLE